MRIYCDGIFDLFHAGHVTTFKYIKNMEKNAQVIVGIISDSDAESYKRKPIISEQHRKIMIEGCKYVDEVIPNAPLIMNEEFINENSIDLVVHGFYDPSDAKKQAAFFELPSSLGKFKEIPYSYIESTSDIIRRTGKHYKCED